MKKSLELLKNLKITKLSKENMLNIIGGKGDPWDSTTKEWTTQIDGHPSETDTSPDPDALAEVAAPVTQLGDN
ncbi:MAG: hypothetical protein AB8G11_00055 [Saprospiraceae bacterium]